MQQEFLIIISCTIDYNLLNRPLVYTCMNIRSEIIVVKNIKDLKTLNRDRKKAKRISQKNWLYNACLDKTFPSSRNNTITTIVFTIKFPF